MFCGGSGAGVGLQGGEGACHCGRKGALEAPPTSSTCRIASVACPVGHRSTPDVRAKERSAVHCAVHDRLLSLLPLRRPKHTEASGDDALCPHVPWRLARPPTWGGRAAWLRFRTQRPSGDLLVGLHWHHPWIVRGCRPTFGNEMLHGARAGRHLGPAPPRTLRLPPDTETVSV